MAARKKYISIFIIFSFVWSFLFWILSIVLAVRGQVEIMENVYFLRGILTGTLNQGSLLSAIFSSIAGYGPLVSVIALVLIYPKSKRYLKNKFRLKLHLKYALQVILLFVAISIVPLIPIMLSSNLSKSISFNSVWFIMLFFAYQLVTSGTEEVGWRGFLLPAFLEYMTPWKASVKIGIIWALWHTPIVIYVFVMHGLSFPQIAISFVGFIAGTIAMSVVQTYYYLKTKNVIFSVFIHAVSNTIPMIMGMFTGSSYMVSVMVQVLLWIFVIIITKRNKNIFDEIQN